jgi:hypothetical protein
VHFLRDRRTPHSRENAHPGACIFKLDAAFHSSHNEEIPFPSGDRLPRPHRFCHCAASRRHLDWQVRCVCAACNNGWMRSEVDEKAREIMVPLLNGGEARLSPDQQQVVAAWATMKAMVAEYSESECVTTHHMHRVRMMKRRLPPEHGWSVWIAHYVRRKWPVAWISTPFLVLPDHLAAKRPNRRATYYNSQVSTQVIGQLFIHVMRSTMPDLAAPKWKFRLPSGEALFRIWPPVGTSIVWPTGTISDSTADYIAGAFKEFMASIARRQSP